MTTRKGYLVALAVLVLGLGGAGFFIWRVYDRVRGMPRVEMPGEATVELPAGDLVAFAEEPSGHAGTFSVQARCAAQDAAGAAIDLSPPGSRTSYQLGSYRGGSMYELTVATAGPVTIRCESEESFVLAFGEGVGLRIAIGAISGAVGFIGGLIIGIRTFIRRRRERRAAERPVAR